MTNEEETARGEGRGAGEEATADRRPPTVDDRPPTTDRGPQTGDQRPTTNDQPEESLAARLRKRRQG